MDEDRAERTMAVELMKVAHALEQGQILVLLFPRDLLDALHAVLNADYSRAEVSASTLSWNAIHRDVIVKPETRIVIIAEEAEASTLHPALLSRVSILHAELLAQARVEQEREFPRNDYP